MDYATHLIRVSINHTKLDRSSKDNNKLENCEEFEKQQNSNPNTVYDYYSEVISSKHIRLHRSGGGDKQQGKPRTPSTLDENFIRVE